MASITVKIFPEEKDKLVAIIRKHKDETISVTKLAKEAGLNPNRSRFILEELLEEGRVTREITKAFNPRFIRYKYEVVK